MDFARYAPSRLYGSLARRPLGGELCSFFFAYTGEFCPGLETLLRRARSKTASACRRCRLRPAAGSCSRCTQDASATRTCASATRGNRASSRCFRAAARRGSARLTHAAHCDVAVVGGGPAGIAAALAATASGARDGARRARRRARRQRHARASCTRSAVSTSRTPTIRSSVHPGLPTRLAASRSRSGGAGDPEWRAACAICRSARRAFAERRGAGVREGGERSSCARAPRWSAATLGRGARDPSQLDRCARPRGSERLEARVVIDTSGEARRGRARRRRHRDGGSAILQRPSFIFRLEGVAARRSPASSGCGCRRRWRTRARSGGLPRRVRVAGRARRRPARLALRHAHAAAARGPRVRAARPRLSRGAARARLRLGALRWWRSCARRAQASRGARVADWPARVGIHETRRALGRDRAHARGRARGPAPPRRGGALDRGRSSSGRTTAAPRFEYPRGPCSIPLGALVARSARRCSGWRAAASSATHEALGALRVIGTALATGEAIGVAAAFAARCGRRSRSVDAERVRERIAAHDRRLPAAVTAARRVCSTRSAPSRARADAAALCADRGRRVASGSRYAQLVARFDAGAERLRALGPRARRALRPGRRARARASSSTRSRSSPAGGCLVPIPDDAAGPVRDALRRRGGARHLVVGGGGLRVPALARLAAPGRLRSERSTPPICASPRAPRASARASCSRTRAIAERLAAANQALAIGPGDRILWLLPMAHHFVVSILLYLPRTARRSCCPASSLARPVLEFAARERATVSTRRRSTIIAAREGRIGDRASTCGSRSPTAEGLRAEIAASFRARFGARARAGARHHRGRPAGAEPRPRRRRSPTALGRPLPGYDVWLRGDDGKPVLGPGSPERTGEICIRGPGLFDAYLVAVDAFSARVLEPDGFRTGDQGYFDADGTLFPRRPPPQPDQHGGHEVLQRRGRGGARAAPGVRECRVFAREHAQLGEIPVAEIVPVDLDHAPARGGSSPRCRAALRQLQDPARVQDRRRARAHRDGKAPALGGDQASDRRHRAKADQAREQQRARWRARERARRKPRSNCWVGRVGGKPPSRADVQRGVEIVPATDPAPGRRQ